MDEECKELHHGIVIPATIAILLACYVLSVGPAVWLMEHDYLPVSAVAFLYMPIDSLATFFTPLGRALEWYLSFWQ